MCSWVFSEASLLQQILRRQTLTVHRSLAHYTYRPTQSAATSSLLNFTHARPYSRQNFSRLENAADLSSPLTAQQRSWLSGCCFCYRGMSDDQTTLMLGQCLSHMYTDIRRFLFSYLINKPTTLSHLLHPSACVGLPVKSQRMLHHNDIYATVARPQQYTRAYLYFHL